MQKLEKLIHYKFNNKQILREALTHSSFIKTNINSNYQRLEFLGNSVLGSVLADIIFHSYPAANEGLLSIIHSKMASTDGIVNALKDIKISEFIIFDNAEKKNGGMNNLRHVEDCIEAIIGAIYIDGGYDAAKQFIQRFWNVKLLDSNDLYMRDAKSRLQEFCQKNGYLLPEYNIVSQTGMMHCPTFIIECIIKTENNIISAIATGKRKKNTEQEAATNVLSKLNELYSNL